MEKFELKRNETVDLLTEVLRKMMKEKTLEKISVSDIAKACNIHRITFYYYFHDKYELLRHMFHQDVNVVVFESEAKDFAGVMVGLFKYLSDNEKFYNNAFASDDYQSMRSVYLEHTKLYFQMIINVLSHDQALRVDKKNLIDFYSLAASNFIINWLKDPNRAPYEHVAMEMVTMIEHGFMTCIGQ